MYEIAFDELKKNDVEPIFQAFTALLPEQQAEIEAEFQDIDNMAFQGSVTALTDEANYHEDQSFPEAIAKIESFHGKVMWAFLEHSNYWAGATLFFHSDNISEYFWKKRNDLPHLPPNVDEENIERLAHAIRHYFHSKEGEPQLQGFYRPLRADFYFFSNNASRIGHSGTTPPSH